MYSIAHLTFSGSFGGREKVAFSLVEALSGHLDTSLYLVVEERARAETRADLLECLSHYNIKSVKFFTSTIFSVTTLKELTGQIKADRIQVLHCHCHKSLFYGILLKLHNRELVVIITLHGLRLPIGIKSLIHHAAHYFGLLLADGIVGCSRELVVTLKRFPLLARKTVVIRNNLVHSAPANGNKNSARERMRQFFPIASGKSIWVGNASRLSAEKNIPLYLAAVRRVLDRIDRGDVVFLLAGEGVLREQLEEQADALQLGDAFVFTGFVAEMADFYDALDLFVLTSDCEGTPMVLLEAMAHGLPVVATAVGGVPDVVVDGTTGLLTPKGSAVSLAEAVIEMMGEPARRQILGEAGRQRAIEEFTRERWVEEHLAYYSACLLNKGVPPP